MRSTAIQVDCADITRVCAEHEIYGELLELDDKIIVELGCGAGVHTRAIAAGGHGRTLIAFEVDSRAHAANLAAPQLPNVTFRYGGAEAIALPDASADVVMMFKSLHHVPLDQLDQAFTEIARVLRPGGRVYISEPVFAGDFNEVIRVFHDEQAVRAAAFDAIQRACGDGLFQHAGQCFFLAPTRFADFAEFEQRIIHATHSEHKLSAAQYAETRARFERHLGADGAEFAAPMRVDLLYKPA